MRRPSGKPTFDQVLFGDPELAGAMATALAAMGPRDRLTHGFHSYPAGLHPDAAQGLVQAFPGDSVLDPFCGGGTVLVEAMAQGRRAHGRDLSSTALRVAGCRTATPTDEQLTTFRSAARKLTAAARVATELPPPALKTALESWYARHAAVELWSLRKGIDEADPAVRPMLEAVLSAIIVKVSWRKSDTSSQREKHRRPPGTTAVLFHKKARELARLQVALREVVPAGTPPADVQRGDARRVEVTEPVDLVLTSPPYPATYDYLPLQHLRRVWMRDRDPDQAEIGARRAFRDGVQAARKRWRKDTVAWTKSAAAQLRPGGHLVVVIGDGYAPSGVVDTSKATEDAAREAGLLAVARASLERPDPIRGSSRWEHVFAFSAPSAS
jgi:hypothetical protein